MKVELMKAGDWNRDRRAITVPMLGIDRTFGGIDSIELQKVIVDRKCLWLGYHPYADILIIGHEDEVPFSSDYDVDVYYGGMWGRELSRHITYHGPGEGIHREIGEQDILDRLGETEGCS